MKPPCEIVVWYVIPAIRSELAKELLNLGMRQKDVSELMDITQPAVSQYITDKRGSGIKLEDSVRKMIQDFANSITEKDIYDIVNPTYSTMYNLLKYIDDKYGSMEQYLKSCKISNENLKSIKNKYIRKLV